MKQRYRKKLLHRPAPAFSVSKAKNQHGLGVPGFVLSLMESILKKPPVKFEPSNLKGPAPKEFQAVWAQLKSGVNGIASVDLQASKVEG